VHQSLSSPSSRPTSGYDLDTLAADILTVSDALKLDRVHLAAHSLGGAEATQLATTRPDRVASIVYLDAALDAAPAEAIRRQAPVPNPQPEPGTPFAQVLGMVDGLQTRFLKGQSADAHALRHAGSAAPSAPRAAGPENQGGSVLA
jgi:pimeloyl-ACP methyl ester carboxylesterase